MSNFSSVYQVYLTGYAGVDEGAGMPTTERLCQALALGVYHRTTSKPPLMSSVAVTAELRRLHQANNPVPERKQWTTLTLTGGVSPHTKIFIIRVIREITGLGLREAKDITDIVESGLSQTLQRQLAGWRPELNESDRIAAAAKLLRDAGCTVEVS